ncbi:MAG: hypothetical protein HYV32_04690 [Candidatus Kerfeldbacteria bacterium]|nr:hypothetical protein [Candidatus Kerfeldbacteria bacterium]
MYISAEHFYLLALAAQKLGRNDDAKLYGQAMVEALYQEEPVTEQQILSLGQALGLNLCVCLVDYESHRWKVIDRSRYAYCSSKATVDLFPVRSKGQANVIFDIGQFDHAPNTAEVIAWYNEPGYRLPDWAEGETCIDAHAEECKENPMVAICGEETEIDGVRVVGSVREYNYGRYLSFFSFDDRWYQDCRFVRVRVRK